MPRDLHQELPTEPSSSTADDCPFSIALHLSTSLNPAALVLDPGLKPQEEGSHHGLLEKEKTRIKAGVSKALCTEQGFARHGANLDNMARPYYYRPPGPGTEFVQ